MLLQKWINERLEEIAGILPRLLEEDASSFGCGYNMGYKHALLDFDGLINKDKEELQC